MQDALVLGGGIVGLSCAIELQRRGIPTTLVAAAPFVGSASWGNAGHIAIEQVEPLASMETVRNLPRALFSRGGAVSLPPRDIARWLPFSLRLLTAARAARFAHGTTALQGLLGQAVPAWRQLLGAVGAPELLIERGHFVLWETPERAERGRRSWERRHLGSARFRDLFETETAAIRQQVATPIAGGIYFTGSGQIADPDLLGRSLEKGFARLGGRTCAAHVRLLTRMGDGSVVATLDSGERVSAGAVIVAAGASSGDLLVPLGHMVPIIAERGYHVQGEVIWPQELSPLVFEDRSMIVTRFGNRLRAASFVEFGAIDAPPDPRKWQRLEAHAAKLGLPFTAPLQRWMGTRPTLPDYLPAIGRSIMATNLFYAFGHQHLGLTLGPLTGQLIGALISDERPPIDLSPFDLRRFG